MTVAEGRQRLLLECQGWRDDSREGMMLSLGKERRSLTTLHVENVMLVQGPATEVGRVQLKALQQSSPFLPQDEAGAGLILKPHRHWKVKRGERAREKTEGLITLELSNENEKHAGVGGYRFCSQNHSKRWADCFILVIPQH